MNGRGLQMVRPIRAALLQSTAYGAEGWPVVRVLAPAGLQHGVEVLVTQLAGQCGAQGLPHQGGPQLLDYL